MFPRTHIHFIILLLFVSSAAFAQPVTGLPPFGSFSGGPFDTIDNANLNVHFEIPIVSKAGRGLPFVYNLTYDSSVWGPVSSTGASAWTPTQASSWGWGNLTQASQNVTGYLTFRTTQGGPCSTDGHTYWYWDVFDQFYYHDPSGASHYVPVLTVSDWSLRGEPCGGGPPASMTQPTNDGSGYTVTATAGLGYAYLLAATNADGTAASLPLGLSGPAKKTDRNGNQITATYSSGVTTFTDTLATLGVPALTASGSGTPSSPVVLSYTNPLGTTSSYTVNYSPMTVQTAFGCPTVSEYGPTATNLVTSIVLPDKTTQYTISYEQTPSPGNPNNVTGRIASVKLPTGGTIYYSYSGGSHGINCSDGSAATLKWQTPDSSSGWTYTHTPGSTTIADPAGNQTVLTFQGIYETQRTVSLGTSGTLTVATCYNYLCPTTSSVSLPITQVAVTQTLPSTTTSSVQSKTVSNYNSYGLPTEVDEYGYGTSVPSPAPGGLARKTTTSYATLGNGIVDRPSTVTVYDSSGTNVVAQASYTYDAGSVTGTSAPQHVSVTGSRGNATTVSRWVTGSTWLSQTSTYFDTGNVYTAKDVNDVNNSTLTTYTYGACGNAFVTNTALPLSLSTQATWNCTGGVQTSAADGNGTTTTNYTDANYWRPTSVVDPTNATTSISYSTNPSASESTLNFNGTTSTVDIRTTLDGLGRVHISQTKQSQTSSTYDSVETDYDSLGRPSRVTVPYSAPAGGTSSGTATTTTYDALGRPTQVTDGGSGTTTYTYNQNDVLVTVGPAASGESTKKRQLEYDVLGRLTSVCEISGTLSGWGTCGQNVSQSGFWTKYTYDPLNDLLTVAQNAQSGSAQTRTFTFDGLGRMKSEQNPETLQVAYGYTYDSDSACVPGSNGDLVKRVDPLGNVTCYAYDPLHRVTAITYPSGSYSAATPQKHFLYDSATVNGAAMQNAKGRLAEAYTGSSKTTDLGFSYSARGEVTDVYEMTPHTNPTYYHVAETYWANGLVKTLNLNLSGYPYWTYNPEGEGRASTVTASSGQSPVTSVPNPAYNLFGLLNGLTFGSADSDTLTYDPNTGRMTQYKATINGSSATGSLTWNQNGSLGQLQIADAINSANNQTCTYTHDDLARISQVSCGTGKWGQTFSYDAFGNITKTGTSGQGTSFTPGYNAATNQFSASNYHFDSNGNLLGDGVNNYIWDADANLSQFNGGTASVYDALSRRVEQTNASGTNEILYGPDGSKLALMSGTAVTKAFVPLPGGATAVYNSSTLAWYRHPDWLGSSRIASTPSRTVSYDGTASYSPFGESPTETGDHSFTGQNQDLVPNFLYDFPAREYHPGEGRWLSPDPAGVTAVDPTNPQSWNRYAYVNGSPLNSVDPSGLTPVFGYTPAECNGKNACADAAFHSSLAAGGVYNLSLAGIGDATFWYPGPDAAAPPGQDTTVPPEQLSVTVLGDTTTWDNPGSTTTDAVTVPFPLLVGAASRVAPWVSGVVGVAALAIVQTGGSPQHLILKLDIKQMRQAAAKAARGPGCRAPEPDDFNTVHENIRSLKGPNGKVTFDQLVKEWEDVLCR